MIDAASACNRSTFDRLLRWSGAVALASSVIFIGYRLHSLDWSTLQPHMSAGFVGGIVGATLLFAASDRALAYAWAATADPERAFSRSDLERIYGRGVLLKYLPGSIFQYVSRQAEGARKGMAHKRLARSTLIEVGLHLVSSMTAATAFLVGSHSPSVAVLGLGALLSTALFLRRPLTTALAFQILAFCLFGLAAILMGAAVLPTGSGLSNFAALFLLAWFAGFAVPVAPGGIGVREASLLALGISIMPPAALMAVTLALRASSIGGDLIYGLATLTRRSRQ